jgi:hypothetical protein
VFFNTTQKIKKETRGVCLCCCWRCIFDWWCVGGCCTSFAATCLTRCSKRKDCLFSQRAGVCRCLVLSLLSLYSVVYVVMLSLCSSTRYRLLVTVFSWYRLLESSWISFRDIFYDIFYSCKPSPPPPTSRKKSHTLNHYK